MRMLQKIIDRGSFKNSQENVSDKFYFSQVTNVQSTDCKSTLTRDLRCSFFVENVSKTYCLKNKNC